MLQHLLTQRGVRQLAKSSNQIPTRPNSLNIPDQTIRADTECHDNGCRHSPFQSDEPKKNMLRPDTRVATAGRFALC